MTLTARQQVQVSCPGRGLVSGRVEEIRAPQDLPDLSSAIAGAPDVERVRAILLEADIDQVAYISYYHGKQQLLFAAFHQRGAVTWCDLRGQELTIASADRAFSEPPAPPEPPDQTQTQP